MSIQNIIGRAREMYKTFDPTQECNASHVGACGFSQCCIHYSAKLYGVPEDCIKLCNGAWIIDGAHHTFVILILDKFYLCDLSFAQFVCEDKGITPTKDYIKQILTQSDEEEIEETTKNMTELFQKGYTLLTEPTLICFYTFCYVDCHVSNNPLLEKLTLNPIHRHKDKVNVMQLTVQTNWFHECDFKLADFLSKGAITLEEKTLLEPKEKEEKEEEEEDSSPPQKLKRTNAMLIGR